MAQNTRTRTPAVAKPGDQHYGTNASFRAKRFRRFIAMVDEIVAAKGSCRVIDLGGNRDYWLDLEPMWKSRPLSITTVNLVAERIDDSRFHSIEGDCRRMEGHADMSFDIVHSNSVLEHVGRWQDMEAMAGEVRRLAPRYYVQTPYFWFPIEPHFKTPFFHWLPEPVRVGALLKKGLGSFPKASSVALAQIYIEDSNLLDIRRFQSLFPDGALVRERVFGLTKSIIAIR